MVRPFLEGAPSGQAPSFLEDTEADMYDIENTPAQ